VHWADKKEIGAFSWQMRFTIFIANHFPNIIKLIITAFITFFYFIKSKEERKTSMNFLSRVTKINKKQKPGLFLCYKHFLSFSLMLVEKMQTWGGKRKLSQVESQNDSLKELAEQLERSEGALLMCSHLGNMDMLWSLSSFGQTHAKGNFETFPIADISGQSFFNSFLKKIHPEIYNKVIDANSIEPGTIEFLSQKLSQGNLCVIAADRVSAKSRSRTVDVDFLGESVKFPLGSFALACMLSKPVYFLFAVRDRDFDLGSKYAMHVYKAKTEFSGPYIKRKQNIPALANEFAAYLQKHCLEHPLQWYNFYDFFSK
jgi:predicted LPLAT superfamily acyltransferase